MRGGALTEFRAKQGADAATSIELGALELGAVDFVASPFALDMVALQLTNPVITMQRQASAVEEDTAPEPGEGVGVSEAPSSSPLNVAIGMI